MEEIVSTAGPTSCGYVFVSLLPVLYQAACDTHCAVEFYYHGKPIIMDEQGIRYRKSGEILDEIPPFDNDLDQVRVLYVAPTPGSNLKNFWRRKEEIETCILSEAC